MSAAFHFFVALVGSGVLKVTLKDQYRYCMCMPACPPTISTWFYARCMYVLMYVCMYVCILEWVVRASMYVLMYTCIHVCMYASWK